MPLHDFFSVLDDSERRELRSVMRRRRFERSEVVFHQGDPGSTIHVIESGWFLVEVLTRAGERVGMTIEAPGDVFGELALLNAGLRTATIRALRPAETMSLERHQFEELRQRKPEVDRFLVALLAARVERLTIQLAEVARTPADQRVCRQVARLNEAFEGGRIFLKQSEIASLAQTTRPTVSNVLNDLARGGVVATGRGYLDVLDPDALSRRAVA